MTAERPAATLRGVNDAGECAFCGSQCGQHSADLMMEFHEAFEALVQSAPAPPNFNAHTPTYIAALAEAKRILDVQP